VFWRTGYERASLDLLLQAMGIFKQSLYDTGFAAVPRADRGI
jgi:hypothetical protein